MNATTPIDTAAAMSGTILALDQGKHKSAGCFYDRATARHQFHTLETTRDELRRLCQRHQPSVVVFEVRALAGWVHDLCADLALACKVANTASEAWKLKHTKPKTDKDDGLRHRAAMQLLKHGIDHSVIALWLGHESVETTQRYLHADLRPKEEALAGMTELDAQARLATVRLQSGRKSPPRHRMARAATS